MKLNHQRIPRFKQNLPYKLHQRIDFGKHIGSKIQLLITYSQDTRAYIQWAYKNIEGFYLNSDAEELLKKYISK